MHRYRYQHDAIDENDETQIEIWKNEKKETRNDGAVDGVCVSHNHGCMDGRSRSRSHTPVEIEQQGICDRSQARNDDVARNSGALEQRFAANVNVFLHLFFRILEQQLHRMLWASSAR